MWPPEPRKHMETAPLCQAKCPACLPDLSHEHITHHPADACLRAGRSGEAPAGRAASGFGTDRKSGDWLYRAEPPPLGWVPEESARRTFLGTSQCRYERLTQQMGL